MVVKWRMSVKEGLEVNGKRGGGNEHCACHEKEREEKMREDCHLFHIFFRGGYYCRCFSESEWLLRKVAVLKGGNRLFHLCEGRVPLIGVFFSLSTLKGLISARKNEKIKALSHFLLFDIVCS